MGNNVRSNFMLPSARGLALATTAAATATSAAVALPYLDRQRRPLQECNSQSIGAALSSLRRSGVAVVDDLSMDQTLVESVKATAAYQSMPTRVPRPRPRQRRGPPGPPAPANEAEWRMSSLGRLHRREETFDESDLAIMNRVEELIWPLVVAFFEDGDEAGTEGIPKRITGHDCFARVR